MNKYIIGKACRYNDIHMLYIIKNINNVYIMYQIYV